MSARERLRNVSFPPSTVVGSYNGTGADFSKKFIYFHDVINRKFPYAWLPMLGLHTGSLEVEYYNSNLVSSKTNLREKN